MIITPAKEKVNHLSSVKYLYIIHNIQITSGQEKSNSYNKVRKNGILREEPRYTC